MKRFSVIVFIILITSAVTFAQNKITGKVISKRDGNAIPEAIISVKDIPNIAVMSNSEGYFTIIVPDNAKILEVSAKGYKTKTEVIDQRKVIVFELNPDVNPNKFNKNKYTRVKATKESNLK